MARVIITKALEEEVLGKFKGKSHDIFLLMKSLENAPQKGKALSHVENIILKELRYQTFRFYFITDGQVLKFGSHDEIAALLIKFIRMSDEKAQQQTIAEITRILKSMGFEGF